MPLMQLPNGRWRVQIRRKGLPNFDKVYPSREEAQRAHDEQLLLPQRGFVPVELTLRELWSRYAASVEYKQKAEHTQRTEATRIKPVLAALGDYALKHLESSPALIYDYIDQRSNAVSKRTRRVISPTSVRLEVAAISAICIWAKRRRLIAENFVRFISRPGIAQRKRRVAAVEQAALMEATTDEEPRVAEAARFVRLLRLLGCRPGELAALRCSDINLEDSSVTFRQTKHAREDRTVHASEAAVQAISAQINHINEVAPHAPYLFPTEKRGAETARPQDRWGPFNYPWAIKLLRKRGIVASDFHAHAARREFVSRAIEDGLEYSVIRKQTGHHSTAAIEIYDQGLATAPEVRDALERHAKTISVDELAGMFVQFGFGKKEAAQLLSAVKGKRRRVAIEYPVPLAVSDQGDPAK